MADLLRDDVRDLVLPGRMSRRRKARSRRAAAMQPEERRQEQRHGHMAPVVPGASRRGSRSPRATAAGCPPMRWQEDQHHQRDLEVDVDQPDPEGEVVVPGCVEQGTPRVGPIAALNANASVTPPNCASTPRPRDRTPCGTNAVRVPDGDRVREHRAEHRADDGGQPRRAGRVPEVSATVRSARIFEVGEVEAVRVWQNAPHTTMPVGSSRKTPT